MRHGERGEVAAWARHRSADLAAQASAVQARLATLEQALSPLAERLPAYVLLRTITGWNPR